MPRFKIHCDSCPEEWETNRPAKVLKCRKCGRKLGEESRKEIPEIPKRIRSIVPASFKGKVIYTNPEDVQWGAY